MLIPVLVIGTWVLAVAVALRTSHVCATPPPALVDVLPDISEWASDFWTQDRVDAQFRAMTAPLSR